MTASVLKHERHRGPSSPASLGTVVTSVTRDRRHQRHWRPSSPASLETVVTSVTRDRRHGHWGGHIADTQTKVPSAETPELPGWVKLYVGPET